MTGAAVVAGIVAGGVSAEPPVVVAVLEAIGATPPVAMGIVAGAPPAPEVSVVPPPLPGPVLVPPLPVVGMVDERDDEFD
jgi:hypothetical protein